MLNRHRKVARIAELVQEDLPQGGSDPESRDILLAGLFGRAEQLRRSLETFPEALVSITLSIAESHRLDLSYKKRGDISAQLTPVDDRTARAIAKSWECLILDDEVMVDLHTSENAIAFVDTLSNDILRLPPDYELTGNIHVSKRDLRGQE